MTTSESNNAQLSDREDKQSGSVRALQLLSEVSNSRYAYGFWPRWHGARQDPQGRFALHLALFASVLACVCFTLAIYAILDGLIISGGSLALLSSIVLGLVPWPPRTRTASGRALDTAEWALRTEQTQLAFQILFGLPERQREISLATCSLWPMIAENSRPHIREIVFGQIAPLDYDTQRYALQLLGGGNSEIVVFQLLQIGLDLSHLVGVSSEMQRIGLIWSQEGRCDDAAVQLFHLLPQLGLNTVQADQILIRALLVRSEDAAAEPILARLTKANATPDNLFALLQLRRRLGSHPDVIHADAEALIAVAPEGPHSGMAWLVIAEIATARNDVTAMIGAFIQASERGAINQEAIALHLVRFAPPESQMLVMWLRSATPSSALSISDLRQTIGLRWADSGRTDPDAIQLYEMLSSVGVDAVDAILLQYYLRGEDDTRAELLLGRIVARKPTADRLYQLLNVRQRLEFPLAELAATAQSAIDASPDDPRAGQAWLTVGTLNLSHGNIVQALADFERAESRGVESHWLRHYRAGEWEDLAELASHPDIAFPVIVTIDLEVDPEPGAALGSRVFEVAAVRSRGRTILATYQSFIARRFKPAKYRHHRDDVRHGAPSVSHVVAEIQRFIGSAIVAGHNLRDFDAGHLRAMGVILDPERIIDTLWLARCLYPDSIRHNLTALCASHQIVLSDDERHKALADSRACGELLLALGDTAIARGEVFLAGLQALVPVGSPFDQAILAPRGRKADSDLRWDLNPEPNAPYVLSNRSGRPASRALVSALSSKKDSWVEIDDPDGVYVEAISPTQKTLLLVASRARLDRMLTAHWGNPLVYVLPDPSTLLCPIRTRKVIEAESDLDLRLQLYCLYQASHNHDAAALFPWRIPADEGTLAVLRERLHDCCRDSHDCTDLAWTVSQCSIAKGHLLLGTYEVFLRLDPPQADLVIADDVADLAARASEWLAEGVSRSQFSERHTDQQRAMTLIDHWLTSFSQVYVLQPNYHERLPLRSLINFLEDENPRPHAAHSSWQQFLDHLASTGVPEAKIVSDLATSHQQGAAEPSHVHAYWVDLWFGEELNGKRPIERWSICGISCDLATQISRRLWGPYQQHLLCGHAVRTGATSTRYLERALGVPSGIPFKADTRSPVKLQIVSPEVIPPVSILNRRKWALAAAALVFQQASAAKQDSIVVTLSTPLIAEALSAALSTVAPSFHRQVLARSLVWGTQAIAERLADSTHRVIAVLSPSQRRNAHDQPVGMEITGPLRFLNQRDPLIHAQMRAFAARYPSEGPFDALLLPQALLELKSRLSSSAENHLVLDSGLLTKAYRDDVLATLDGCATIEVLDSLPLSDSASKHFMKRMEQELDKRAISAQPATSDAELTLILRTVWDVPAFRELPSTVPPVTQGDIVRGVLNGCDQLVVLATGGGKSLCFQLPAIVLAEQATPQVTLVFSPLIALMRNQVEDLNKRGIFSAILLNSTLSPEERQEHLKGLQRGIYSIVYLAPEQIHSAGLRRALENREIGLIAVDEAHCLSQWGHDFRTDYFALKKWIERQLCRGRERTFPIIALTATARRGHQSDQASTVKDIVEQLQLTRKLTTTLASTVRQELVYRVEVIKSGTVICHRCSRSFPRLSRDTCCPHCGTTHNIAPADFRKVVEQAKRQRLVELFQRPAPDGIADRLSSSPKQRQRGLVYCAYRKTTEEVAALLQEKAQGLRVKAYHAGLDVATREEVLRQFTTDSNDEKDGLDVVVATNAFGMGIDVRRLGFVIHIDTPATLEAYYQEAGRAGRDAMFRAEGSQKALCLLLYHPSDLDQQRYLRQGNLLTHFAVEDTYQELLKRKSVSPNGICEVVVTDEDLAASVGIKEKQVGTAIYYLEYYARIAGSEVLERGETTNRVWSLSFEQGYHECVTTLPPGLQSHQLLNLFLNDDDFMLSDERVTAVPLGELKERLGWSYSKIEQELLNLVKRRIVAYRVDSQVRWMTSAATAQHALKGLNDDLRRVLECAQPKAGRGASAQSARISLHECALTSVSATNMAMFLFNLAQDNQGDDEERLITRFARDLRSGIPDQYEVVLGTTNPSQQADALQRIKRNLQKAMICLEGAETTSEWKSFDLYKLEPEYHARRILQRSLMLLHVLGLIHYSGGPTTGVALKIRLLQPDAIDALVIDLKTLRLKETYDKHKLRRVGSYASDDTDYAQLFEAYFRGDTPLIERLEMTGRSDLTPEQQQIVTASDGYHLIEGPAGCGKTTALVERIRYLVYERHVPIECIMVTTHYQSAVARIERQMEVLRDDGGAMLATTINSFGQRIFQKYRVLLRRYDGEPYYPRELHLAKQGNQQDQSELAWVSKALQAFHQRVRPHVLWPEELEQPCMPDKPYQRNAEYEEYVLKQIRHLREHGIFPTCVQTRADLLQALGLDEQNQEEDRLYGPAEIYVIYAIYLEQRGMKGEYTFDDQILFALTIFRTNRDLLQEYHRYFEHIIIDEIQDFTPAADALFQILSGSHGSVMVFGDEDQAIRVKEGKTEELFARFRQRGSIHRLNIQFRSTQEILNLALELRNYKEALPREPLVAARGRSGIHPHLVLVPTGDMHLIGVQSKQVNNQVLGLLLDAAVKNANQLGQEGATKTAIILAKSDWKFQAEKHLVQRAVPFAILANDTKYQSRHVANLLAYFYLIADPHNDEAMKRLLRNCVVPYFDYDQIEQLQAQCTNASLLACIRDPGVGDRLGLSEDQRVSLANHLAVITAHTATSTCATVVVAIRQIDQNPIESLSDQPHLLKELEQIIDQWADTSVQDALADVKRHLAFIEESSSQTDLILTTIDNAKSSEFDNVILIAPDKLYARSKLRLYVAASRARDRLTLICEKHGNAGWLSFLRAKGVLTVLGESVPLIKKSSR